jgi:isopenicillin-N epimerase
MAAAQLPPGIDLVRLKSGLYAEYRVEIPLISWNGLNLVRISIQGYNSPEDVDALIEGLANLLPVVAG